MNDPLLSIRRAADIAGCSTVTVQKACRRGVLRHRVVPGQRVARVYLVRQSDLMAWLASDAAPQKWNAPWSDDEVAALIEIGASATDAQVARYLRRTVRSVRHKRHALTREGITFGRRDTSGHGNAFHLPSTGVLIAKSCPKCGAFLDAHRFKRGNGSSRQAYYTECRGCENARWQLKSQEYAGVKVRKQLQDATSAAAFNEGRRYTEDEVEVLRNTDLSDLELAVRLGRSIKAVAQKRIRIGARRRPFRDRVSTESRWSMLLDALPEKAREAFVAIGPPPESAWEWTDERVAS